MVRLFCPTTQAFYPDVTQCSQTWVQVLPGPAGGTLPQSNSPQPAAPSPQPYAPQSDTPQSRAPYGAPAAPAGASRGYDVTASAASPYVKASAPASRSEPMATAYPARPRILVPAPRADLPRRATATQLAQTQVD